eukprot:TRINITY_DN3012_c0_g3_i2.p1 TRINITY_DN3012_c0_g3~~TRINITY_DN3012_c0_g3_i2.p1  ORF type:complete len:2500 (-),score=811.26 TRINITY_DN3012_c0_g3_i2:96-7595(-)
MSNQYWLPNEEHIVLPCTLSSSQGSTAGLITSDGQAHNWPADKLSDLVPVQADQLEGRDDVCSITFVNEGVLLHTVRTRYKECKIYTRVARTLIAVNPFRPLPIYESQYVQKYMTAQSAMAVEPHIFGIGSDALRGVRETGRDQAVLVSGESGSGKTESAKLILSFVAESVNGGPRQIEEMVLRTNPILESFGNAMTVRNNNSSRFGKWLDLRFSASAELLGCTLTSYLLETVRVCSQGSGERGFHVFFQLLQARDAPGLQELRLLDSKKYNYLKHGQVKAPGINDAAGFTELKEAMVTLGFGEDTQSEIFRILAGILLIGNLDFKDQGEACKFVEQKSLHEVADLLRISAETLSSCLLSRQISVGRDVTKVGLKVGQARAVRDALSRLLYGRLFAWLLSNMNERLAVQQMCPGRQARPADSAESLLGVLDIAGFESFTVNSLEQLMINLSNEHLQQEFNRVVFKSEKEECLKEGVQLPQIDFNDNADCLALIDSKGGVLDLLDDANLAPNGSDTSFVNRVLKEASKHARLIVPKFKGLVFGVKHFAGDVLYTCDGWLEKNADRPPQATLELLLNSGIGVLQELGESLDSGNAHEQPGARGGRRKAKSVTAGFRTSLRELMEKISNAEPHHVKCIKPNTEKVPDRFTAPMVMEQLLFSGVLATVQIRQKGFASRIPHTDFVSRFRCVVEQLAPSNGASKLVKVKKPPMDLQKLIEGLPLALKSIKPPIEGAADLTPGSFVIGKTKVFMKLPTYQALEDGRRAALRSSAMLVQRIYRGYRARKQTAEWRDVQDDIQELLEPFGVRTTRNLRGTWDGDGLYKKVDDQNKLLETLEELTGILERAKELAFRNYIVALAEKTQARLQLEMATIDELENVRESVDPVAIERALARAQGLDFPNTKQMESLQWRLGKLRTQLPLLRAMRAAIEEFYGEPGGPAESAARRERLEDIVEMVDKQGLVQNPDLWLTGIDGAGHLQTLQDMIAGVCLSARTPRGPIERERRQSRLQRRRSSVASTAFPQRRATRAQTRPVDENWQEAEKLRLLLQEAQMCRQKSEKELFDIRESLARAMSENQESAEELQKLLEAKTAELEAERQTRMSEVHQLREDLAAAEKRGEETELLEMKLRETWKDAERLRSLLHVSEEKDTESQRTLEMVRKELADAKTQGAANVAELQRELESKTTAMQDERKQRAVEVARLAEDLADAKKRGAHTEGLQKQLDAKQRELDQLQGQLIEEDGARQQTEKALEVLRKELVEAKMQGASNVDELQRKLDTKTAEYEATLQALEGALHNQLAQERKTRLNEIDLLKEELAYAKERGSKTEELQRQLDKKAEEHSEKMRAQEQEFRRLLEERWAEAQSLQGQLQHEKQAREGTEKELQQLSEEFARATAKGAANVADLQRALEERTEEYNATLQARQKSLMDKLEEERELRIQELEKVQTELANARKDQSFAAARRASLARVVGEKATELEQLREVLEGEKAEKAETSKHLWLLQKELAAAMRQGSTQTEDLQRQLESLQNKLKEEEQQRQEEVTRVKNELARTEEHSVQKDALQKLLDEKWNETQQLRQLLEKQEETGRMSTEALKEELANARQQGASNILELQKQLEARAEEQTTALLSQQSALARQLEEERQLRKAEMEGLQAKLLQAEKRGAETDELTKELNQKDAEHRQQLLKQQEELQRLCSQRWEEAEALRLRLQKEEDYHRNTEVELSRLQQELTTAKEKGSANVDELQKQLEERSAQHQATLQTQQAQLTQQLEAERQSRLAELDKLREELLVAQQQGSQTTQLKEALDEQAQEAERLRLLLQQGMKEREDTEKELQRLRGEVELARSTGAAESEELQRQLEAKIAEQKASLQKQQSSLTSQLEAERVARMIEMESMRGELAAAKEYGAHTADLQKMLEQKGTEAERIWGMLQTECDERKEADKTLSTLREELAAARQLDAAKADALQKQLEKRDADYAARMEALQTSLEQRLQQEQTLRDEMDRLQEELIVAQSMGHQEVQRLVEERYAEEKAKMEATPSTKRRLQRSATITGLTEAEQAKIRAALEKATAEYDVPALEELLGLAAEDGMDGRQDDDVVDRALQLYKQLQSVRFLQRAFEETRAEVARRDASATALRRLGNISRQLRGMPGHEESVREVNEALQQGLLRRQSLLGSQLSDNFGSKIFRNLSDFSRLKPAKLWGGHYEIKTQMRAQMALRGRVLSGGVRPDYLERRRSSSRLDLSQPHLPRNGTSVLTEAGHRGVAASDEMIMLSHNRQCITEALTRMPNERGATWFYVEQYEAGAVHNFSNLLVCMGDRSAQECQRLSSRQAIVDLANTDKAFLDEIYVQLMKQLTRNPSARSIELGWGLFQLLCESAPPPTDGELIAFVRTFIQESLPQLASTSSSAKAGRDNELTKHAEACLDALNNPGILGKIRTIAAALVPSSTAFRSSYSWMPCCLTSATRKDVTPPLSPRRHLDSNYSTVSDARRRSTRNGTFSAPYSGR